MREKRRLNAKSGQSPRKLSTGKLLANGKTMQEAQGTDASDDHEADIVTLQRNSVSNASNREIRLMGHDAPRAHWQCSLTTLQRTLGSARAK